MEHCFAKHPISSRFAGCIERITSDELLREELIRKGTANCQRFSPKASANIMILVYAEEKKYQKNR